MIFLCLALALFCGCNRLDNDNKNQSSNPPIVQVPALPPVADEDGEEEIENEKKKKVYIVSKTDGLRIRSGAGDNYTVVGSLDKSDALLYKGEKGNYYVSSYKEKTAYVHKNYCTLLEMDTASNEVESAIDFGSTLLGYPYVWGSQRYHWGNGKLNTNFVNGEFDCSALVQYVYYKTNDVLLDLTSRAQSLNGKEVQGELMRGDLMFFTNASRINKQGVERIGHVGIFMGNNYILHTASDHAVIEPISNTRWGYFITARRVV